MGIKEKIRYTEVLPENEGSDYDTIEDHISVHYEGVNDYTLCGLNISGEMPYEIVKDKISCKDCIKIITACKKVRKGEIECNAKVN